MSETLTCSKCGRNVQMRTEILAKNWRKSGKTRKQYMRDYVCSKCRVSKAKIVLDTKGMMEIPTFKKFALEIRDAYKICVKNGMGKENIKIFQNSVVATMRNNRIQKFEYIINDGILYGIRLPDLPIFGTVEISTF